MYRQTAPSDESLHNYATRRLTAKHLRALSHILTGQSNKRNLSEYIDTTPNTSADSWATRLVNNHSDNLEQFLHILDTEFSQSEISANDVVDYLVSNYGSSYPTLTTELLEEQSRPALLVATYFCMYDIQNKDLSNDFQNLLATAKIYKQNSKSTFVVENERVPFNKVENNIKQFLSDWNTEGERKQAVQRDIDKSEEMAQLKLYREKYRTARHVFQFRQEGRSTPRNPSDPSIEYESEFAVDTLGMSVRNRDNSVKIEYSGDLSGWAKITDRFLRDVFEIDDGADALIPKPYPGVNHVLDSARQSARQLNQDEEDELINRVNDAAEELWEAIIADLQSDSEISCDEVESANEWYESLALSGFRILKDEQTNVHRANVRSQGILEDVEKRVSRLGLVEYFQQVEDDKIGLYFQIENPETDERAVFEVHQDEWSVVGRGIESAAFERVDRKSSQETVTIVSVSVSLCRLQSAANASAVGNVVRSKSTLCSYGMSKECPIDGWSAGSEE